MTQLVPYRRRNAVPARRIWKKYVRPAFPYAVLLGAFWWGNFLKEWSKSTKARTFGIPNFPPTSVWGNLWHTSRVYHNHFSDIANFTNGYRSWDLHKAIYADKQARARARGETPPAITTKSSHLIGGGVDLVPKPGYTMAVIDNRAAQLKRQGIIHYYLNEGDHVHVTVIPNR